MQYLWRFLFVVGGVYGAAGLAADVTADVRTLRNEKVRVDFDPGTGLYSIAMPPAAPPVIRDARVVLENWSSADADGLRRIVSESNDRLVVECSRTNGPTLLATFVLHPAYLELRAGVRNTTGTPLRVRKIRPLDGGMVFPGGTDWSDARTLDAPTGAHQTRVDRGPIRSSANNLLLTFTRNGRRRTLVLGALTTADYTKWAHLSRAGGVPTSLEAPGLRLVAYTDCGSSPDATGRIRVVRGKPYTWAGTSAPFGSVIFDEKAVVFKLALLDPRKHYVLGFSWWDRDANGRVESVTVSGADGQRHVLIEKRAVPSAKSGRSMAAAIPAGSYADGTLQVSFANEAAVPNAVVSELWLWEAGADAVVPADIADERSVGNVAAALEASDPVGKLVEAGETYLPEDSFYVDAGTPNPFDALEQYGRALREATRAAPNPYDFPTVCAWYAGVWKTKGAQNHPEKSTYAINTTAGLVEEATKMRARGFLNYSRAAGRLVPDNYTIQNPQGWWDDAHWREHGLYTAPYETSAKFGEGMHSNGTLAFTYIQPTSWAKAPISLDFREQHTGWLCGADINRTLDYSRPEVQAYLLKRFGALRGHIDGLMIDYCDDMWIKEASRGGFADPHMTATAFYRTFVRCVKTGLGPQSWVHERAIGNPNNDLVLGLVDSQRTANDTDKITPDLVSRSGLRWYKNRVVIAYDMDSKELTSAWKVNGWTGSDRDGRRMMLTMAYVAASRLLLANSFRDLDPDTLHDLERTFPYPEEPRSARPIDAFTREGWPRVYDFAVSSDWHQVTLFNTSLPTCEETIAVPLAGDTAAGALGLEPAARYHVYDFWNDVFVGTFNGSDTLEQTLRPGEARMLSIRKVKPHPQVLSTNRHIMQGYLELSAVAWDGRRLTGKADVAAGEPFRIVIALNGKRPKDLSPSPDGRLAVLTLESTTNANLDWSAAFE